MSNLLFPSSNKSDLLVQRKRKLAELYCVSRLPLLPISNDQVLQIEDKLMGFLQKNDLEKGQEFKISTLASDKQPKSARSTPQLLQPDVMASHDDILQEEPASKRRRIDQLSLRTMPSSATVPLTTVHVEGEEPTLSTMIRSFEVNPAPITQDMKSRQDLDVDQHNMESLLLMLIPEALPHKVGEVRPLTELYYHTQTLPLIKLLPKSQKVLTSEAYESALLEGKVAVLYSRIEELKRQKKWSLRQMEKFKDPLTKTSAHWDNLLAEGKWLAVDFKEERKFKMYQSYCLAQAVMEYWALGKEVCIKRAPIRFLGDLSKTPDLTLDQTAPQTEYIPEPTLELPVELSVDPTIDLPVQPAAELILQQGDEPTIDVTLLRDSPAEFSDSVAIRTPNPFRLFANVDEFSQRDKAIFESVPSSAVFHNDRRRNGTDMPIDPISRLLTPVNDDEDEWYKIVYHKPEKSEPAPLSYQKSLFGTATQRKFAILKPPKPPSLLHMEVRTPTIWLPQDDQMLIHFVVKYAFNWKVISAHMEPGIKYVSNIEKRTPWQCFERYIQLYDKFQFSDMKGPYASSAQHWLEAAHKVQTTTRKRISPIGVGPDSIQRGHKRLRYGSMFEAIRKCMRKRENTPKPSVPSQKKPLGERRAAVPTPTELTKLKFERDKAIQEAYLHQSGANGGFAKNRTAVTASRAATPNGMIHNSAVAQARSRAVAQAQSRAGTPPVGGNPTTYSNEQLQNIVQMQRQRQLAQKNSNSSSSVSTPPSQNRRLQFAPAQVSALISKIQSQHPNMSKEEVTKLAATYIANLQNYSGNGASPQVKATPRVASSPSVQAPFASTYQNGRSPSPSVQRRGNANGERSEL